MNICSSKTKDRTTVCLKGEISIYSISELHQGICTIEGLFDKNITLDMSEVTEIDTAGVQLLIYLRNKMRAGKNISVENPTTKVNKTLTLMGIDNLVVKEG